MLLVGKGIGYYEWFFYFNGEQMCDELIVKIKQDLCCYVKCQLIWFCNKMLVDWINLLEYFELWVLID